MPDLHLRLVLDVKYDVHEASQRYLVANLRHVAQDAAGKGSFTGDSSAEVDEWKFAILTNPDEADRLFTHEEVKAMYRDDTWGTHPKWPRRRWLNEIEDGSTLLGYWHWVEHQLFEEEANANARKESSPPA
jgi:hypothetical protein